MNILARILARFTKDKILLYQDLARSWGTMGDLGGSYKILPRYLMNEQMHAQYIYHTDTVAILTFHHKSSCGISFPNWVVGLAHVHPSIFVFNWVYDESRWVASTGDLAFILYLAQVSKGVDQPEPTEAGIRGSIQTARESGRCVLPRNLGSWFWLRSAENSNYLWLSSSCHIARAVGTYCITLKCEDVQHTLCGNNGVLEGMIIK